MELWEDQGVVLGVRSHGESGAVVWVLTHGRGVQTGYVRGAQGSRMRGTLEIGNRVDVRWQARDEESLGSFTLELASNPSAAFLDDRLKLSALQSACALCKEALPEREVHAGVYDGLLALFETMQDDIWREAYVFWEIALLRELGFFLDLRSCAGGGDSNSLAYVSPKTGRAVSLMEGEPYKGKLLGLPRFLGGVHFTDETSDVALGLGLTGYFLAHWVFNHHSRGVPEERVRFESRFVKALEGAV